MVLDGYGYWSGQDVRVEFHPAPPGHGLVFSRVDCENAAIPAVVGYRCDAQLRTNLSLRGISVEMVEHILAAFAGLGVDNAQIRVNATEMPGVDGSCLPFVNLLRNAGIVDQPALRDVVVIKQRIRVGNDLAWVEATPHSDHGLHVEYHLDFGPQHIIASGQFGGKITPEFFQKELAPARTFILQSEANELREMGYGARVSTKDLLLFDDHGLVENELRFSDECVRHKALDLVGDLALAGCDIWGSVHAHRSGHRLNAELVQAILKSHTVTRTLHNAA